MKDKRLGKQICKQYPKCPDCPNGYMETNWNSERWWCEVCGVSYEVKK